MSSRNVDVHVNNIRHTLRDGQLVLGAARLNLGLSARKSEMLPNEQSKG